MVININSEGLDISDRIMGQAKYIRNLAGTMSDLTTDNVESRINTSLRIVNALVSGNPMKFRHETENYLSVIDDLLLVSHFNERPVEFSDESDDLLFRIESHEYSLVNFYSLE